MTIHKGRLMFASLTTDFTLDEEDLINQPPPLESLIEDLRIQQHQRIADQINQLNKDYETNVKNYEESLNSPTTTATKNKEMINITPKPKQITSNSSTQKD